jgi:hypothetical protein
MSRFAAIDIAVRLQLLADNNTINYANLFKANQPGPPVIPGYGYDKTTMRRFLLSVADRLKRDTPPVVFAWRMIDIDQCLDANHLMLVSLIEDQISTES